MKQENADGRILMTASYVLGYLGYTALSVRLRDMAAVLLEGTI